MKIQEGALDSNFSRNPNIPLEHIQSRGWVIPLQISTSGVEVGISYDKQQGFLGIVKRNDNILQLLPISRVTYGYEKKREGIELFLLRLLNQRKMRWDLICDLKNNQLQIIPHLHGGVIHGTASTYFYGTEQLRPGGDAATLNKAHTIYEQAARSVTGGTVTVITLEQSWTAYRAGDAISGYWALGAPSDPHQYAYQYATDNAFYQGKTVDTNNSYYVGNRYDGNQDTHGMPYTENPILKGVMTYEIPAGTTIYVGEAAPQNGIFTGGAYQIFLEKQDWPMPDQVTCRTWDQFLRERNNQGDSQQQQGQSQQELFEQLIQQNSLENSFNASHPETPISKQGAENADPGGVMHRVGFIEGLSGLSEVLENDHLFAVQTKDNKRPFSDTEFV